MGGGRRSGRQKRIEETREFFMERPPIADLIRKSDANAQLIRELDQRKLFLRAALERKDRVYIRVGAIALPSTVVRSTWDHRPDQDANFRVEIQRVTKPDLLEQGITTMSSRAAVEMGLADAWSAKNGTFVLSDGEAVKVVEPSPHSW
jgi:hypothetical protein